MTFTPYATATDLDNWLDDDVPDNAATLLRSATFLVALGCQRNPFGDAPTGSDADALTAATCAQAASWIALGIDPAKLGIGGPTPVKSATILGAKVDYDTAAQAKALESLAQADLAPEAEAILFAAGLLWMPTAQGDPDPGLPTYGLSGARLGVSPTWANSTDAWPFL